MYEFWSIYRSHERHSMAEPKGGWYCIPPSEEFLPKNYPLNAIKKHEQELLPPPSYWLKPEYEAIVYSNHLTK